MFIHKKLVKEKKNYGVVVCCLPSRISIFFLHSDVLWIGFGVVCPFVGQANCSHELKHGKFAKNRNKKKGEKTIFLGKTEKKW